jgi:hypothetical protein
VTISYARLLFCRWDRLYRCHRPVIE